MNTSVSLLLLMYFCNEMTCNDVVNGAGDEAEHNVGDTIRACRAC